MSSTACDDQLTVHPEDLVEQAVSVFKIGNMVIPEPIRQSPQTVYYMADPISPELFASRIWDHDAIDNRALSAGICHLTKEAAIAHAKALIAVSGGTV